LRATLFLLRNVPLTPTLPSPCEGRGGASVVLLAFLILANTANGEPLKNHYNDPFVQVTRDIQFCRQPRGPFMTLKEAQAEAHPRIERGTTCFRAGKCTEPNSYRYDARIAVAAQQAISAQLVKSPALAHSSVWITVQRRFVFVQGCVARRADVGRWEFLLRRVPEVEYVGVDLAVVPVGKTHMTANAKVPYPVMPDVVP